MLALGILGFAKRRINYTENHERPSMLMTQATRYDRDFQIRTSGGKIYVVAVNRLCHMRYGVSRLRHPKSTNFRVPWSVHNPPSMHT
jgi:hypothetical protein